MDFTTAINIAQYVLSVLIIPALWFIVKLWNNVSHLNAFKEEMQKAKEKAEAKEEEKEQQRVAWERDMYTSIIEMKKDLHHLIERTNK